ncbi:hypothetical protein LCGC14_0370540 [marine sediment metagenome]|uniref:Uncharacterized protein n=1 Tax=marine sediment metagenome TaxID=412755 RepID=A0A0F9WDR9_9ZZZZ|nr:hypothetical protein [Maribacter sp.]HDZ04889.1 hypothetical protein [Maribacter sp.]
MKKKKIDIPIYGGDLTIYHSKTLKYVRKKHKLVSTNGFDAITFRTYAKNGYARYYLAFKKDVDAGIIAHEALHIVSFIFQDYKIKFQLKNDEPQCYLLEWIVKQVHEFIDEK